MRYLILTIGVSAMIGCSPKNYPETAGNNIGEKVEPGTKEVQDTPKIFADSAFYDPNPVMERRAK